MYIWILVHGKVNYSALVFRKINVFVAVYPWSRTKLPPSHSVTPFLQQDGKKISWKYSWAGIKTGGCLPDIIMGKTDSTWEKVILFSTNSNRYG